MTNACFGLLLLVYTRFQLSFLKKEKEEKRKEKKKKEKKEKKENTSEFCFGLLLDIKHCIRIFSYFSSCVRVEVDVLVCPS